MLPLHGKFEHLLLACSEGCSLRHNSIPGRFKVGCYVYLHMHIVLTGNLDCTEHAVSSSCILATLSHGCDIKHTCFVEG